MAAPGVAGGGAADIGAMITAMTKAQETQAIITTETMKHQTVMALLDAMKNAFKEIKS